MKIIWGNIEAYPLALHRESISSMNIVLGAYALARSNKHRTIRSLSPRHLEAKVAEDTLKKVVPHSVATALARSVFPVPGGPNMRTPFHGLLIPCKDRNSIHKGSTTASSRSLFASVSPATSSHLTPGEVSNTSRSSIAANSASGPSYCPFFDLPSSASPFCPFHEQL
ncbi:hypothetical protein CR513_36902, partial [Mucuna pruriens]